MLSGTIAMLIFIVVVIFGGAGFLMNLSMKGENKDKLQEGGPTDVEG